MKSPTPRIKFLGLICLVIFSIYQLSVWINLSPFRGSPSWPKPADYLTKNVFAAQSRDFQPHHEEEETESKQKSVPRLYVSPRWHQALSKQCYRYEENLTAINTCCKMYEYNKEHLTNFYECAKRTPRWFQDVRRRNASRLRWEFIGDSHVRDMFEVLTTRLNNSMFLYRKKSYKKGDWRPMDQMGDLTKYSGEPITVKHVIIPLTITYMWDPLLMGLKKHTQRWLVKEEEAPTLIYTGACLHWIKKHEKLREQGKADKAAELYKKHLISLSKYLQRLSEKALVVFHLQDYQWKFKNNTNIDVLNQIASTVLPDTVSIMSSNVPLSNLYQRACEKNPKERPGGKYWKCNDIGHSGQVVIMKYVDMLLNYGCNRILDLDDTFCK